MAASVNFDEVDDTPLEEDDLPEVLLAVESLRNRADDLGIALKLSPSFCVKGVELKAVLHKWLKQEGKDIPSWRSLVKAVKNPVGGENPALAKKIARQHLQKKLAAPIPVSTAVPATGYEEPPQQKQPYSLSTNVSTPHEEVQGGSTETKLVCLRQPSGSLTPSVATGASLSSIGDPDSVLSVSTCAPTYDTQTSHVSNPTSLSLVPSSVPSVDSQTPLEGFVSQTDPTTDQESNPPTIPDQPSEPAELDASHIEVDAVSSVTNPTHPPDVHGAEKPDRQLFGDGGGDLKVLSKVSDVLHEEEDLSDLAHLRHTEDDSGHNISAWLDSIKQRQRRMKHMEDDNPYREFTKPYSVASSSKKHGIAVIMNIATVTGFPFRAGSKEDEKNLCKLFEMLRYKVHIKADLSSNEIRRLFQELRDTDCKDHDSFVCCILTHGSMDPRTQQDTILGADGSSLTVRELKEYLIANNSLNGKPKLFFIQACRGNYFKLARLVRADGVGDPNIKPDGGGEPKTYIDDRQRIRPYYSDVFVGYATTLGMKASRDSRPYQEGDIKGQAGSWYIIELCSVLTTLYKTHDLVTMVTIVHDILARDSRYLKLINKERGEWYRQAAQFESTLTRPFYFEQEAFKAGSGTDSTDGPEQASPEP